MKKIELNLIADWFYDYVRSFAGKDGDLHYVLGLKLEHSKQVSATAALLACETGWDDTGVVAAEAAGLLHDVGRFSQFSEFKTLSDAVSVNHGLRGWEVVLESSILTGLAEEPARRCILDSIRHHNARTIPSGLDMKSLECVKLIRDADKLDIFQVVQTAIRENGFRDLRQMLPDFKLDGPISRTLIEELKKTSSCSMINIKSLADFMLMQLAWVHDINYPATYREMARRDIVPKIAEHLPADREVAALVEIALQLVNERSGNSK